VLRIGQRLAIPRADRSAAEVDRSRSTAATKTKSSITKASLAAPAAAPIRHRPTSDETLAKSADRSARSSAALSPRNDDGNARNARGPRTSTAARASNTLQKSWRPYAKAPKRKGYLNVSTPMSRFNGAALDSNGRLRPSAVRALNALFGAGGRHPALPERLIRLLVRVSDTFGGRPIRVVSGYRTSSYYEDSRHKLSSAVDFRVHGVPNAVICEYLREIEDVGVGYYPNSSFVHLDVRSHSAYWVDYSGPGEAPRSTPTAPSAPHGNHRKLFAELDSLLKQTEGAIAGSRANHGPPPSERRARERPTEAAHAQVPVADTLQ
jgi:uncharacterized protein YcbK (DUF882 family)